MYMRFLIPILFCSQAFAVGNFHEVTTGLYRGAQPSVSDLDALKKLGVRTIIKLNSENPEEIEEAERMGITIYYVPLSGFWAPSDSDMNKIEALLSDQALRPIFLHCEHGEDRTGLAFGLYRWRHGWSKDRAHDEMMSLGFHPLLVGLEYYFWNSK
jgi:protein tyrosine/serine phosphatase